LQDLLTGKQNKAERFCFKTQKLIFKEKKYISTGVQLPTRTNISAQQASYQFRALSQEEVLISALKALT